MNNQFPSSAPSEDTPLGAILAGSQVDQGEQTGDTSSQPVSESADAAPQPSEVSIGDVSQFVFGEDSKEHTGGTCVVVNLFGSGCLDCSHLVEDADTDFRKCHYTKGNTHCPARVLRIQFVGARVKWEVRAKKILAMENGLDKQNAKINYLSQVNDEIEQDTLRYYAMSLIGI